MYVMAVSEIKARWSSEFIQYCVLSHVVVSVCWSIQCTRESAISYSHLPATPPCDVNAICDSDDSVLVDTRHDDSMRS